MSEKYVFFQIIILKVQIPLNIIYILLFKLKEICNFTPKSY